MTERKKAALCLASQMGYLAVIALLTGLRVLIKVPLFTQIVAFIGLLAVDFCPLVSAITGVAGCIFSLGSFLGERPKWPSLILLGVTAFVTILVLLYIKNLQPILFYG